MPEPNRIFVDRIATDLGSVRWPPPEEIRARARRRSILTTAVAPTVVALALAAGWAVIANKQVEYGRPAPRASATLPTGPTWAVVPPASPSSLPTFVLPGDPAWIGPEALLQPEDVGPGMRLDTEGSFEPREYPAWTFDLSSTCAGYRRLGISAYQRYEYMRIHNVERDVNGNGVGQVHVEVERYPDRLAQQVVADIRRIIDTCANAVTETSEAGSDQRPARGVFRWALVAKGFAGEESLLLRQEAYSVEKATGRRIGPSSITLYLVVRVQDLVTIVQSDNRTEVPMRRLGQSAATRLCQAASPPC